MDLTRFPLELLEQIIQELGDRTLVNLSQCSRALHALLTPLLFARPFVPAIAMQIGSRTGNHATIALAHAYGAPLDRILVPRPSSKPVVPKPDSKSPSSGTVARRDPPKTPMEQWPLELSLETGNEDTFRYIMALGGSEMQWPVAEIATRLNWRAQYGPRYFLLFEEAGFLRRDDAKWKPALNHALLKAAERRADLEDFKLLLDLGANPEFVKNYSGLGAATALGTAISYGMDAAVRLMISRGANVRGPSALVEKGTYGMSPKTEPMAVAVQLLASHGNTEMVDLLREHGVGINECYAVSYRYMHSRGFASIQEDFGCISPLCTYLDSFNVWDAVDKDGHNRAMKGLWYLKSIGIKSEDREVMEMSVPGDKIAPRKLEVQSALVILFTKWRADQLVDDNFFEIAKMVVGLGVLPAHLREYLMRISWPLSMNKVALGRWKLLLDILLRQYSSDVVDGLFFDFLISLGETLRDPGYPLQQQSMMEHMWRTLEQLNLKDTISYVAQATLEAFLSVGASINERRANRVGESLEAGVRPTALFELCTKTWNLPRDIRLVNWDALEKVHHRMNARRKWYLEYLLGRGANPNILVGGKTAKQKMLETLDELQKDEQKQLVMNLVEVLEREGPAEQIGLVLDT